MTDTPPDDSSEESLANSTANSSTPVTSAYKVLGELTDPNGVGVLGQNNASTGTPIAVQGAVPNTGGFGLYTNDAARVDGVLATATSLTVEIDGNTNISHGSDTADGDAGSVVLGHSANTTVVDLLNGVYATGATISSGRFSDGSTTEENWVNDNYGTIGGGRDNQAGDGDDDPTTAPYATVGGGLGNTASDFLATVGGGSTTPPAPWARPFLEARAIRLTGTSRLQPAMGRRRWTTAPSSGPIRKRLTSPRRGATSFSSRRMAAPASARTTR